MKIDSIKNNTPNFKGALNNKILLSSLEKVSDHGATFMAGASFVSALALRPLAISMTPKTDKENKKFASINSVASGLIKLAMVEAVVIPLEEGMKKIDKNPEKFLKKQTLEALKSGAKEVTSSGDYKFASQLVKLGGGLLSAIPKSVMTVALIPVILDMISKLKNEKTSALQEPMALKRNDLDPVFKPFMDKTTFKGGLNNVAAKGIGKFFDNAYVLNFVKNNSKNGANVARNVTAATDVLLTTSSSLLIAKSDKIDNERKKPLIYNNIISTGASVLFGCAIDELVQKASLGFVEKFKNANALDPKLSKYIEGINIIRPTLIFALVYYGLLPMFSTFMADKIDKSVSQK